MKHLLLAMAGLALAVPASAWAVVPAKAASATAPAGAKQKPKKRVATKHAAGTSAAAQGAEAAPLALSADVLRVANWVTSTADNQGLPYIIIDKKDARLTLFSAAGKPLDQQPVLIGLAVGDLSTPGVGSKNLAEIGTAEKTTPAGRFLARFGIAAGRQKVLWVDYANSVALHPIPATANPKERRRQRILSPVSEDHRITFGCINVPKALYSQAVVPLFRKQGGYVYVLPDQLALDEVFPLLRAQLVQIQADQMANVPGAPGTAPALVR